MPFRRHLLPLIPLLLLAACEAAEPPAPPPIEVVVAPVLQRDVEVKSEWIGTTEGSVDAKIRAQISGLLLSRDYAEGRPVATGDLLFRIDPRPYQAALDQARGEQQRAVVALRESVKMATTRYLSGLSSYFEVLDAQLLLYPAEFELARIRRDQNLAVVALYRALGGGWNADVPEPEIPLPIAP